MVVLCFFFFSSRRRHTRCYRDWSSDVCSSDLAWRPAHHGRNQGDRDQRRICGVALHARDRRLRPAHLRNSRLSHRADPGAPAGNERLRRMAGRRAMRAPPRPGFLVVATRELRWMRRDRVALFLAIGVPIFAFAILAATFSNAVIRNLKVSVVDADRSPTSLIYVQAIASAPGVSVAERSGDMTSAMQAIRSGDGIAAIYIPENFERDLVARQRPKIVVLYNRQYFTPGNSASAAISNAVAAATATLPHASPANNGTFAPGSLVVEQYVLTNPALNYAQ